MHGGFYSGENGGKLTFLFYAWQGDFLLIILKNLLEKQSSNGAQKLKVILMYVDNFFVYAPLRFFRPLYSDYGFNTFELLLRSATVDSNLFSRYFGNCPVITAEGRTHPVKVHFLEDIYESLNYRLASDSPAAIRYETSSKVYSV